jgi:hypothetical protein
MLLYILWTIQELSGLVRVLSRRDCAAWRSVQRTRFGSQDSLCARPAM